MRPLPYHLSLALNLKLNTYRVLRRQYQLFPRVSLKSFISSQDNDIMYHCHCKAIRSWVLSYWRPYYWFLRCPWWVAILCSWSSPAVLNWSAHSYWSGSYWACRGSRNTVGMIDSGRYIQWSSHRSLLCSKTDWTCPACTLYLCTLCLTQKMRKYSCLDIILYVSIVIVYHFVIIASTILYQMQHTA